MGKEFEKVYMYIWKYHNIVNQLSSNIKLKS